MRIFELLKLHQLVPASMRKIVQAAVIVAAATVVVKSVGFIKEMFVANSFGLSQEMDSFVIASSLSIFLAGILASSIQASLIPWLSGMDERDAVSRNTQVNQAYVLTIMVAATFATILYLFSDILVALAGYALSEQSHNLAVSLVKIFSLQLFFVVINTFFYSILQKRKRFFVAGLTPVLIPLSVLLSIVLFADNYGVFTLAFGAAAGSIIEMLILLFLLTHFESRPRLIRPNVSADLRKLISQSWIMIVGGALMGSTLLVDRSMASTLGAGAVSSLAYASRVPSLIDSLGAVTVATAVLPYFSDMVSRKDWLACKQYLKAFSWALAVVSIPLTLLFIYASHDIVEVVFEHGAFSAENTVIVASLQQMYLLAIPPFIVALVAVRMLSALSMNHLLALISFSNLVINVVLNVILMKYFSVLGIALSTAIMYLSSCIFCVFFALYVINRNLVKSK